LIVLFRVRGCLRGVVGFMLQYLWSIVSQKIICFLAGWGSSGGEVLLSRLYKFEVLLTFFPEYAM
jgi:hypothetical protein